MGLRGPAPKPTALKVAAGNPGKRTLNEDEPIPPPGEISPPEWLSPEARKIWDRVADVLLKMRTLTTADVDAFARYCEAYARWIDLNSFMMKKGPTGTTYAKVSKTEKDSKGKPKVDYVYELPQASEWRQLFGILQRFEDRFGMNASSRSRIRVHLTGGTIVATPQQAADEERRNFFAGGGPRLPRLVSQSEEIAAPKTRAKRPAKTEAGGTPDPS